MIGSGIFVSPVSIAQNCGSVGVALLVWVLSGILVLLIALCYAELGMKVRDDRMKVNECEGHRSLTLVYQQLCLDKHLDSDSNNYA